MTKKMENFTKKYYKSCLAYLAMQNESQEEILRLCIQLGINMERKEQL